MKAIQRIIYTGFAAVALASAAMPVFPAHTLPEVRTPGSIDFEGYAWIADDHAEQLARADPAGAARLAAAPRPHPHELRR